MGLEKIYKHGTGRAQENLHLRRWAQLLVQRGMNKAERLTIRVVINT